MTAPHPRPRRWPWLLAWLLLTVYFVTPPRDVADTSLDKSNYATYAHFVATGAQWGADVIPMTGPYGFILYGHTYAGEIYWLRLFGDLALKGLCALLLLHLFRRAGPGALRWCWMAAVILLVPTVDDLFHDYAILLAGLCLLVGLGGNRRGWSWLAAVLLGLLALFKGTHLLTTAITFGLFAVFALLERQGRAALQLAGVYLGSLVGFWLLARQNLLHLPAYIHDVLDLSSGYNATMGYDEPPVVTAAGLAVAAGLLLLLVVTAWCAPRRSRTIGGLLLLAGFGFIKWKHGFLRADGHVAIFFASAAVFAPTITFAGLSSLLAPPLAPLSRARRAVLVALTLLVTGAGIIGAAGFWLRTVATYPGRVTAQLQRNARYLARPARLKAELEQQLDAVRRDVQVPQIQNEVKQETTDFFGFQEGLILLNRLNYHPRPMGGGSFNVFTPRLQRINEAFLLDPGRAPVWEVMLLQTLDDRLPAGDDPLTLEAILQLYSPVLMQRDFLLLKRRPGDPDLTPPAVLRQVTVRAGETLAVPATASNQMLLFSIEAPLSLTGRLRSFIYRPPQLALNVTSDRHRFGRAFQVKPLMFQHPVILSPLLEDNFDVLHLFSDDPGDRVRTIRFEPQPGFANDTFRVTFYTAPRPPAPEDTDVTELLTYRKYPLYNRKPVSLVTQETGIREINLEPITLVHAPGSITWNLEPGDQQVIFSYGIYPKAYLEGNTDGVEFNVEVLWPPNDGRVLWKQMLSPVTYPPDRGMHRARVFLPPYRPGAQLRIRTHPGPANNGAFDQSYITRLQIKQGKPRGAGASGLVPEQFNGLGVVPANGLLPNEAVAAVGGRPVFLIHAPNELVLNLPSHARRFTAEIGLLPGAYENGGHSDGVEYTVFVVPPGGGRTAIWSRYLDPFNRPEDRGPVSIGVNLPKLPAGSQLVVTTGIGPHGDRSWDQSWIANVRFR
ncbi:MAG: hypothetical protein JSR48_02890 [Verrucomicrobia bacterium]|nr:hypothetical protein [Verrucomicrobiota bacterium]